MPKGQIHFQSNKFNSFAKTFKQFNTTTKPILFKMQLTCQNYVPGGSIQFVVEPTNKY